MLQCHRHKNLFNLSAVGSLIVQEYVSRQLLRNGTSSHGNLSAVLKQRQHSSGNSLNINSPMTGEILIFHSNNCQLCGIRKFLIIQISHILFTFQLFDFFFVDIVNDGGLFCFKSIFRTFLYHFYGFFIHPDYRNYHSFYSQSRHCDKSNQKARGNYFSHFFYFTLFSVSPSRMSGSLLFVLYPTHSHLRV